MKVDEVAALLHVDSVWTWSSWLSIQLIMIRIVREVVRHTNIEFTYLKDQFFEKYQSRIVVVEFSEMDLQMSPSKLHEVFALVAVLCSTIIWQSDSKGMYLSMKRNLIILINLWRRQTISRRVRTLVAIIRRTDVFGLYEINRIDWKVLNVIFVMNVSIFILFATILTRESHRSVILMCVLSLWFDPDAVQWSSSSAVSSHWSLTGLTLKNSGWEIRTDFRAQRKEIIGKVNVIEISVFVSFISTCHHLIMFLWISSNSCPSSSFCPSPLVHCRSFSTGPTFCHNVLTSSSSISFVSVDLLLEVVFLLSNVI